MKIAITGGTGFVGGNLARLLVGRGHEVVLIARPKHGGSSGTTGQPRTEIARVGLDDPALLARAFAGCHAVAHCAGINREAGRQTFARVHVEGTKQVVAAAKAAGVGKVLLLSFLRARPNCGSKYHESKFAAEEIVRASGLDYTVIKAGVIYGRGDHMLDHLSHALHTFPIFALVGFEDRHVRPCAVEEMSRVLAASLVEGRLSRQTVAVTGPEEMPLPEAVRRVARVVGKTRPMVRMPLWFHYAFAWFCERTMKVPLASVAQIMMLSEGIVDPLPSCEFVPDDLAPRLAFTDEQIRLGLPDAKPFGLRDCRCAWFGAGGD